MIDLCLRSFREVHLTNAMTPQNPALAALPFFEPVRVQEPLPYSWLTVRKDIILLLEKVDRRQPFSELLSLDKRVWL